MDFSGRSFMDDLKSIENCNTRDHSLSKLKALEIIKRNNREKESPRDFIEGSRKILLKSMNIQNIKEEQTKLQDYIVMEREKIKEAELVFNEDCQKFEFR